MPHTFISRLAENPSVSEQTIKALAGHVSRQMMGRYTHIRLRAKQAAIETLNQRAIAPVLEESGYSFLYSRRTDGQAKLTHRKQIVGPVGFEPTTNGL